METDRNGSKLFHWSVADAKKGEHHIDLLDCDGFCLSIVPDRDGNNNKYR